MNVLKRKTWCKNEPFLWFCSRFTAGETNIYKKLIFFFIYRNLTKNDYETLFPEMIYHWLTCNFDYLDLYGLTSHFIQQYTPEHRHYMECIRKPCNKDESDLEVVKRCILRLHTKCKKARTRTIKTIRLTITMAGKLLKWLPRLKIIHLVRDPRGILNSRFEQNLNKGNQLSINAQELCDRLSTDISTFRDLEFCHRSRMLRVVYEELCQYPRAVIEHSFTFLNSNVTTEVLDYAKRIMTGPVRSCSYCVGRGNALKNAYRWLSVIDGDSLHTIDRHCSTVYSKLGYIPLDYDKLKHTLRSWQPMHI